jgi:hypothetical protein
VPRNAGAGPARLVVSPLHVSLILQTSTPLSGKNPIGIRGIFRRQNIFRKRLCQTTF